MSDSEKAVAVFAMFLCAWGSYKSPAAYRAAAICVLILIMLNLVIIKEKVREQTQTMDRWFFKWQTNDRARG